VLPVGLRRRADCRIHSRAHIRRIPPVPGRAHPACFRSLGVSLAPVESRPRRLAMRPNALSALPEWLGAEWCRSGLQVRGFRAYSGI
jgi:hypothetical protein